MNENDIPRKVNYLSYIKFLLCDFFTYLTKRLSKNIKSNPDFKFRYSVSVKNISKTALCYL